MIHWPVVMLQWVQPCLLASTCKASSKHSSLRNTPNYWDLYLIVMQDVHTANNWHMDSFRISGWYRYNSVMKVIFLGSSFTIIYYMRFHQSVKQTYDKEQDSFNVAFILGPCAVLALLINQEFGFMEVSLSHPGCCMCPSLCHLHTYPCNPVSTQVSAALHYGASRSETSL